jgi:hypothetical protein
LTLSSLAVVPQDDLPNVPVLVLVHGADRLCLAAPVHLPSEHGDGTDLQAADFGGDLSGDADGNVVAAQDLVVLDADVDEPVLLLPVLLLCQRGARST